MTTSVLTTYLRAYRKLIAVEPIDQNSITLSFPFHLAANHRIEITVTDLGNKQCILSDAGRTIGEIEDAGHTFSNQAKERLERLANLSGVRIVKNHLVLQSTYEDLGGSMQRFLEMSKMIGDVYLIHKQRADAGDELLSSVRMVFDSTNVAYRQRQKLRGRVEDHPFDLFIPPNGRPGLALSVVAGQNTHALAQIWYCKCDDIHSAEVNKNIKLALVYDERFQQWSNASRALLEAKADLVISGNSVGDLPNRLDTEGVIKLPKSPRA